MTETDSCDCECKGVNSYTPVRIYNPSGLSSLSYRVGTHGRFKAQMISEIGSTKIESVKPLEKLTTQGDTDLTIAIFDSWATIADVLTFYQERIANEGFLRTATERRSVLELARSIGYELRPGVAASTNLAFKMDSSPTSPDTITIDAGTKVQSIPGKDEKPQVFETSESIKARQQWSVISPQLKTMQDVGAALARGEVIFEGVATRLRIGDGLLFIANGMPAAFRIAQDVEVDAENKQTLVRFNAGSTSSAGTLRRVKDDSIVDSDTNFTGEDLNEILAKTSWTEPELEAKVELEGWSLDVIVDTINSLATEVVETNDGVYAFRIKCSVFGHNAPMWKSLPPEMRYKYIFDDKDDATTNPQVEPPYPEGSDWDEWRAINRNSLNDYYDKKDDTDNIQGNLIYLDSTYPAILPERWIVLKGAKNLSAQYVTGTREDSLTEFALAGKATGLSLDLSKAIDLGMIGKEFRTGQESPVHGVYEFTRYTTIAPAPKPTENEMEIELEIHENFPPINSTDKGAVWSLAKIIGIPSTPGTNLERYHFRKTSVYAQPEQLALAKMSVEEMTLGGQELVFDKMIGWLQEGQLIVVEGELTDSPGIVKREIATVKSVTHSMTTLLTTVKFDSPLMYVYRRDTVFISANVARATHGETKTETVGSGDPSQRFQSFKLKQSPLTFVSDTSPRGAQSTVQIKVHNVAWKEVPSFEGLLKSENAYLTRIDNDSGTRVIFGDGTNGKLPPSGFENIQAMYRVGIGMVGLVEADKLTLLMKRPLGVKSVTNPLAATGAADPEQLCDARKNAPRTVLTLDRVVSPKDYADFARGFAGVGKATSYEVEYEGERVMLVAVASSSGGIVDDKDELYGNLKSAIESYKDPTARFILRSYNNKSFDVKAKILISGDHKFEDVQPSVKFALRQAFSFESREFGQAVSRSEVVSVIQSVGGVEAVDIDYLHEHGSIPTLERIIRATSVELEGAILPSLLLVNEEGIILEEMTA